MVRLIRTGCGEPSVVAVATIMTEGNGMADSPEIIGSLEDVSKAYSAILCDVWGVVHNGETHFP
ncbi:TIGR01459 family HAD-type hydrolase, partial [Mesorhizobium sp. M7A.F.Ca.US.001.04.1.1]